MNKPYKLSTWNFEVVIVVYVCVTSLTSATKKYHFVAPGGGGGDNIQSSNFIYFCIIDKNACY